MSLPLQICIAVAIFLAGMAGGIKYQVGVVAAKELAATNARESDARQQRKFNDKAAGDHAAELARLSNQLGIAREHLPTLPGRACLDAGTVRVLNDIGNQPVPAAAGKPDGAPKAAATDRDVATAISICRAWYGELSSQVNQILDIEAKRQGK